MEMLTKQQIFDKVATHLLKQGCRSTGAASEEDNFCICKYRGNNGLMCAAGALILDEHYSPSIEDNTTANPDVAKALKASGVDVDLNSTANLVGELQTIHDHTDVDSWRNTLRVLAVKYDLSTEVLQ